MSTEKTYVKCDVCGNPVLVDNFGNGEKCPVCGWRQSEEAFDHPNTAGIRNIPSLNNAIKQFKAEKSATLANYEDFIATLESYGEVEFTYDNIRFGVLLDDSSNKIILLNTTNNEMQYYYNVIDFAHSAKINGTPLEILWDHVTSTDFLQETK